MDITENKGPGFTAGCIIVTVAAVLAVILRAYSQRLNSKAFRLDEFFLLTALVGGASASLFPVIKLTIPTRPALQLCTIGLCIETCLCEFSAHVASLATRWPPRRLGGRVFGVNTVSRLSMGRWSPHDAYHAHGP